MKKLQLSETFSIPAAAAVTQTFGVLAVRGAGKSNAAAVMAEEMYDAGLPFVAIDPVGSWWGLRAAGDGKAPGLGIPIFGGHHGDIPLERSGAELVADLVVEQRLSCVLDVSAFESESAKRQFLTAFAERLFKRKGQPGHEGPLHLFLEEADDYAPQMARGPEMARCLGAFQRIVKQGRARGLGATMITQRSAALNKDLLTQLETLIVLRTTSPQDRKAIAAWVEYHGQARELLASLPQLQAGEAWVWSPQWLEVTERIRFRRRRTFDSGATPKDAGGRRAATLADVDLAQLMARMAETVARAKADDPRELKKRVAELERQLAAKPAAQVERVDVPVLKDEQIQRLELAADRAVARVEHEVAAFRTEAQEIKAALALAAARNNPQRGGGPVAAPEPRMLREVVRGGPAGQKSRPAPRRGNGVVGVEQRVINALAELQQLGADAPERELLAFMAGYSNLASKGFANAMGALRTAGYIDYPGPGTVALTSAGAVLSTAPARPSTPADVQRRVMDLLGGASSRILQPLIDAYPKAIERTALAAAAGYGNLASKGFANSIGRLRTLGFIRYPDRGTVAAAPVLFLEGREQ